MKDIVDWLKTAKSTDGFDWSCRACKKAYDDNKKELRKKYSQTFFDEKEF